MHVLPEFEAISFIRIIEKGAHTKPWLIEVGTNHGPVPYIVKIYTVSQNTERNSITAEVIGNALAKEFDLKVPQAALIHFPIDFIMFLDKECQMTLDLADGRPKFGTEYLDGSIQVPSDISKSTFARYIDLDTLFAFDNFIRNTDRGQVKTNLLLHKKEAWLIDHEMAVDISINTITEFDQLQWEERFYRYHLCYNYLKKASRSTKILYFETFSEYLRLLNIGNLTSYFDQLEGFGYNTKKNEILEYLGHIKLNSCKFVGLLKTFVK